MGSRVFLRPTVVWPTCIFRNTIKTSGYFSSLSRGLATVQPLRPGAGVRIVEMGPRDGLQSISKTVPIATKVQLIQQLASTGLSSIEATSFVLPKWIPQLADGGQVMKELAPLITEGLVNFPVLVPNQRGLEKAVESGAREVEVFVSATEGFSQKNTNCSVEEALDRAQQVTKKAIAQGLPVRGYVSAIFLDPYDGPTDPSKVLYATKRLLDMGCYEVSLGDTLGVGTPKDVERLFEILLTEIPASLLGGHFHDTYGQAVANVVQAYRMGIRAFDSSVAGLGGCPYAPGAKGNLATEDIVYTFQQQGVPTGVDLKKLVKVGDWISRQLGQPNGSRAGAALHAKMELEKRKPGVSLSSTEWKPVQEQEGLSVSKSRNAVKITLTRPRVGNTLTQSMVSGLTDILKSLSTDESVFHILLAAEGKFFCTGMDLSTSSYTTDSDNPSESLQYETLTNLFSTLDAVPQTTIAVVNGPCFGGGVGLAFMCDIRLVSPLARFTLSEIKLGLTPATISKYVVREWGIPFFREAMLTGREVYPEELHQIGAVHSIANGHEGLHQLTEDYLGKLRFCAPGSASMCKDLVRAGWMDPNGKNQEKMIESVYKTMMKPSAEARFGIEQFRQKVKNIDWGEFYAQPASKL